MTFKALRYTTGLCLLAIVSGLVASVPAHAAKPAAGTYTGTLQNALYRIDVPPNWNGDLVMLMHGYQPVGAPITTPMTAADSTPVFLKKGFAVAQSQFASQGFAVSDAIADTERLREHFALMASRSTRMPMASRSAGWPSPRASSAIRMRIRAP